ncbi:hypothetical protein BDD12DRAFT_99308 [Trichophaea hybrida]|nr:hypothetical protein BDD12DRAFT_99308 [Trichophaea hybrida]
MADIVEFDLDSEIDLISIQQFLDDEKAKANGKGKEKDTENASDIDSNLANQPEPIALGHSITTTYIKDLIEILQTPKFSSYNLKAVFETTDTETDHGVTGFTNTLKIKRITTGDVVKELKAEGCYPSKRHAKEATAGVGLNYVKELPEEITSLPQVSGSSTSMDPMETEDWVGKLQAWCNLRGPYPKYTFYENPHNPQEFSCDITEIPTLEETFGSKEKFHRTKKVAKVQAAKEAMLWIKANASSTPASLRSRSGKSSVGTNGQPGKFVGKVSIASPGSTIEVDASKGAAEKVSIICPQLGLSLPEYHIKQDQHAPSLYDIYAILRRREGKSVRIGPLKGEHGRKKAKNKLAECILGWLHKEAERIQVTINQVES